MQHTLILATSHRGLSDDTYECMLATGCQSILKVKGLAHIDRARCTAFDRALTAFEEGDKLGLRLDTLLCIDDDMLFSPTNAQRLVDLARSAGEPTSASYVMRSGKLCGRKLTNIEQARLKGASLVLSEPRWMTGLGFMAVPRSALERIAPKLPRLAELRLWCESGAHPAFPDGWLSEDFWFCLHFGGVRLSSIEVGHLKTVALYPGANGQPVRVVMPGTEEGR